MTEPISDEDLAKFREVHQRTGDPEMGPDRCIEGRWVTWPCASVAVLARLDAAESRARDAEGERELYDTAVAQANYWVRGYKDAFDKLAEDAEATITSLRLQVEEGEREREELAKASHLIDVYDHCDCTYDCICDENGPCVTCALGIRWRFAYSKALDAAGITDDSYIDAAAALAPIEGDK